MKSLKKLALIFTILILIAGPVSAITIKFGSLAPVGSPWDNALKQMAADWREISGGRVILKIYPGGIAGGEADMLRKMKIGQLQAAGFTTTGLARINPDVLALSLPFLIRSDNELQFVLEDNRSELESVIEKKGFVVLGWTPMGWVHFFTKDPVVTPQDLMKQKLCVTEDAAETIQAWKDTGFRVVPLAATDTLQALQSGMADAFFTSPLIAASYQWFALAPNMCRLPVSPMVAAFLIDGKTWRRIPEDIKPDLLEAVQNVLGPLYSETRSLETEAITTMEKYGLTINEVPPSIVAEWDRVMTAGLENLAGKAFSKEFYKNLKDTVVDYRDNAGR
jgi:TRAP-type transport system periplasmic protein